MLAGVGANVGMWEGMGHCHLDWLEISRGCKNKRMALDWLIHCKPEALGAAGMPRAVHAVFCSSFHLSRKGGWCFAILIEVQMSFQRGTPLSASCGDEPKLNSCLKAPWSMMSSPPELSLMQMSQHFLELMHWE